MTNLKLGVAFVQQYINDVYLTNVAMLFELLSNLGPNGGHGDVETVHCLNLRRLQRHTQPQVSSPLTYQYSRSFRFMLEDLWRTPAMSAMERVISTNRSEPFSVWFAHSSFGICPIDCYLKRISALCCTEDKTEQEKEQFPARKENRA